MSDVDIVHHLKDHYDQEEYGLSAPGSDGDILLSPSSSSSGRLGNDFPTEVPRPSDETCDSSSTFMYP
ncbi:hypothetical protein K503DRAFT_771458, partial [Rhizopogon vinicolor AM-OR11-026]